MDVQHIVGLVRQRGDEQPAAIFLHGGDFLSVAAEQIDAFRTRLKGPHDRFLACVMRAKETEGIIVAAFMQGRDRHFEGVRGVHVVSPDIRRSAVATSPDTGTAIQSGRFAAS